MTAKQPSASNWTFQLWLLKYRDKIEISKIQKQNWIIWRTETKLEHVTAAHWLGHIKEEKVAIKLQNAPLHPISRFVQMCCTSFQFEKHKIQNNITTNTIKQSQQM